MIILCSSYIQFMSRFKDTPFRVCMCVCVCVCVCVFPRVEYINLWLKKKFLKWHDFLVLTSSSRLGWWWAGIDFFLGDGGSGVSRETHCLPRNVATSQEAGPALPKLLVYKFVLHLSSPSGQVFPAWLWKQSLQNPKELWLHLPTP